VSPLTFDVLHTWARRLTFETLGDESDREALKATAQELFDALPDSFQNEVWRQLGRRVDRINGLLAEPGESRVPHEGLPYREVTPAELGGAGKAENNGRRDDLTDAIRAVPLDYVIEILTGEAVPASGVLLCVLHEDREPSFKVYPDHFHCFGCGAHGSAFDFAADLWRLDVRRDFVEVRNRLADQLLAGGAA
jgi:hypothetical protein